ncbi:MAG: hypothetical protein WBB84_06420 [Candidatus Omnitrophota bacterium]
MTEQTTNHKPQPTNYRIIVILFFAVFLCVGLFIYRDYGISWDELVSRNNGLLTYKYVFQGDQELLTYRDRYYGTAFEVFLILVEKLIGFDDPRGIFLMRHLTTFLLFYLSTIVFYFLCRGRFRSRGAGMVGVLFLVLSPRIFAHSFYNSKDLAFLSLFIISMFSLVKYLERKTLLRAFLHALASAFLVSTRILGIIVPVITFLFVAADIFLDKERRRKEVIIAFLAYLALAAFFTVMFWPILWIDPLGQFLTAFRQMSRFHFWSTVLYLGEYVKAESLPWHYIPVWILVTTPVIYIVFFAAGLAVSVKNFFTGPADFYRAKKVDIISVLWFFIPLASVIALRSVLYDGWRHVFFIYPAFVLISLSGVTALFDFLKVRSRGRARTIACAVCAGVAAACLINTAWLMVKWHPYQNVYFNVLTGNMENAKDKFDLDYWGLSYRQALEYIAQNDKEEIIKISAANPPARVNLLMLELADRARFVFVEDSKDAKYFMSNYRWHKEEYPYKDEFFSIKVGGAKIMVVYKLR